MTKKQSEKRGLGRGLSALMADVGQPTSAGQPVDAAPPRKAENNVPTELLYPNPNQPRRDFDKVEMDDLANSVREMGIIQPLIVRKDPVHPECYQIVAGERRWRAAQQAQLHEVPVLIRELTDLEVLELAIVENIQRADLNPVEEAQGYRQLMDNFGHTQEKMAEALGKSRSHIANVLRLLSLPAEILTFLREGKLTAGHARALVTAENPVALAKKIVSRGLSVRQAEKLAKKAERPKEEPAPRSGTKDADTQALELDLSANLNMKVLVDHAPGTEHGTIAIHYTTLDQLDELCRMLTAMTPVKTK